MRYFNTSGPNFPEQHYTLYREDLIQTGLSLVEGDRYFTIWAPRQTGKSTYFRQLNERLSQKGYKVAQFNFENYRNALINYQDYLAVEEWYLTEAIDKNFANILKQARAFRPFIESLLFTDTEIPFRIDREAIKVLHTNGLIRKDNSGNVAFWVPYYKKRLHDTFYPYTNGERDRISATIYAADFFLPDGQLNLDLLIGSYKAYAKRRGFGIFREKDEKGKFTSIKEAGLIYSFETFIAAFISEVQGHSYRKANTGLGKSDLIINIRGQELLVETKKYYSPSKFEKGKQQLAYYASRLGLVQAVYLVFCPNHLRYPPPVFEGAETLNGVDIRTYLVDYDEEKDFD